MRIQVISQGMNLESTTYDLADKIDTLLDEQLNFAFNDKLGYLTQCPTNIGTGMRASLMLHLPSLKESGAMGKISSSLSKLGLAIRGMYGEGTEPKGAIYQLSNQVTLGISEQEAINNLRDIAYQLVTQERTARETLAKNINIQDRVYRSYGILQYAKLLNNEECMQLLSNVFILHPNVEIIGCFDIYVDKGLVGNLLTARAGVGYLDGDKRVEG